MKAHRTDLVSLTFGLLFLVLAAWWLLARLLGLAVPPVGWFLAGALVVIGLLGVAGAVRSARSAGREPTAEGYGADEQAPAVTDAPTEAVEDRPADSGAPPERLAPREPLAPRDEGERRGER